MNPLPSGFEHESSGDAEVMQDVFRGFAGVLGTAVLLIYAVLVLLFANFLHPLTIMATLPLSVGGALLGLLVGQKSLGPYALIGVVLLMGIVTNNSILLVDYAIMSQQFGKPMSEATLDSGVARLWQILMTTNWRCWANSQPDGDGANWQFDDFYAADSGGDSAGFYLHGWLANLDF